MKIVVDSSVLIKLYLQELASERAHAVLSAIKERNLEAHVPSLARYELLSGLTKGLHSATEAKRHLQHYDTLVKHDLITEHPPSQELILAANVMAFIDTKHQGYISSYDASFHVLAIALGAVFVTADEAHVRRTVTTVGSVCSLEEFVVPV